MASEKLTATKVARARAPGMIGDGGGLWLRITAGGSKGWIFRFMIAGRSRAMGLGSVDDVTLAEARELARQYRKLVKQGLDPIEARRAERTVLQLEAARAMTFEQCAERYIAAHQAGWGEEDRQRLGGNAEGIRLPGVRRLARPGNRRRTRHEGDRAALADQVGDGEPGPRQDRERPRLGDGTRLPRRREPGALARPPRKPARQTEQGPPRETPRRPALCRDRRIHHRTAAPARSRRTGARIRGIDGRRAAMRRSERPGTRSTLPRSIGQSQANE